MSADERIDRRFDRVDQRFESFAERLEKTDRRISDLKDSLASAKLWALVPWAALVTALLFYALAHGFKGV